MNYRYDLTQEDYFEFNLFIIRNYHIYNRQMATLRIIFALSPIVMGLFSYLTQRKEGVAGAHIINLAFMILLAILFYKFFPRLHEKLVMINLKHILKQGELRFLGDHSFTFEEDQMHIISKNTETSLNYEALYQIKCGSQAIYFLTSASTGYILPFRVFSDEKEKNEFLSFINQKIHS